MQIHRFAFSLLFLFAALTGSAQKALPVLRVTMDGAFEAGMDYRNGRMQLTDTDGSQVALCAKFKTRGATAREYMMKPSFNMKLRNEAYSEELDSALLGMRSCSSWILDAMAIDRICMRNRVAFDIWNSFSHLPYETDFGGRCGTVGRFVEVYVNDVYYGIYCLTDRINRKLLNLKKVKMQEDGTPLVRGVLYKSGTQDILNQNSPCYSPDSVACVIEWHNAWELSYPEDYAGRVAWAPLQEAILEGNDVAYVKQHFYLQNLADNQIHLMALSIVDNWGNKNRFISVRNIHKDINAPDPTEADRRRMVVLPWDLDTSLGGQYDGSCYDGNYSDWPVADIMKRGPYPFSVLLGDDEYLALLRETWLRARRGALSVDSVRNRLAAYRDLFLESGAWQRMTDHFDAQAVRPCYVRDLAREVTLVGEWYERRFREMDAYFGIVDGLSAPSVPEAPVAGERLSDLQGRPVSASDSRRGVYLRRGRKFVR